MNGPLAALVAVALASGCARPAPPQEPPRPAAQATPPLRVALAPEPAAACIAGNAHTAGPGAVAHIQPLYGTERLAVIVRARPAGEALAVAYLDRHSMGSEVRLTTMPQFVGSREELARRLLTGC